MSDESALHGVSFTSLIPLYGRALENQHPDPILKDKKASDLVKALDYDFSKLDGARVNLIGAPIRAKMIDEHVKDFLQTHPNPVVINLGAGFDTRFERLTHGNLDWYDLDLPEIISLRQRFFPANDQVHLIPGSVLDQSWMDEIEVEGRPLVVIAEGLLMYFSKSQVKSLFIDLATTFHRCEVIFDIFGYGVAGKLRRARWMERLDPEELAAFDRITVNWAPQDVHEMEKWGVGIQVKIVENLLDFQTARFKEMPYRPLLLLSRLFPRIKDRNGVRIVRLQVDSE